MIGYKSLCQSMTACLDGTFRLHQKLSFFPGDSTVGRHLLQLSSVDCSWGVLPSACEMKA